MTLWLTREEVGRPRSREARAALRAGLPDYRVSAPAQSAENPCHNQHEAARLDTIGSADARGALRLPLRRIAAPALTLADRT